MTVERRVRLSFGGASRDAGTHTNLSAVRDDGRCLWVAGDETATLERLTALDGGRSAYGDQRTYRLADLVDLPAGADEEADVEGIGRADGWLWAVGSHSRKRRKVKAEHSDAKAASRLAELVDEPNRHVLVRVPVLPDEDGLPELHREVVVDGERRTAAVLGAPGEDRLTDLLADDEHLGAFLGIPGKENGLDVEGIAAHGRRLYLGLRGPVLRGWAVLLEVHPYADGDAPGRLRLGAIGPAGEPYRKHFLDLAGLGVRDLAADGDDLLLLVGPSMDLDGPVRLVRWRGGATVDAPDVVRREELVRLVDLDYGEGDDHAEGIAVLEPSGDGATRVLVVHDSPAPHRLVPDGGVLADVVRLP